jgi:hypothetical protein
VLDVVGRRTPGFESWQQDHWLYHCEDACAFLGRVGQDELDEFPEAIEMLLHENDSVGWSEDQSRAYVAGLEADGDASAYLFRCLGCGTYRAFSDSV